jgi:hypothetical protein
LEYPNYLTIVSDNGSRNDSAEKIKAWAEENLGHAGVLADYRREEALAGGLPETEQALDRSPSTLRMVLIRNEENLGFIGGNNNVIHYALRRKLSTDFVFLVNPDVTVASSCLKEMLSVSSRANAAIVGAPVLAGKDPGVAGPQVFSYVRWLFDPLVSIYATDVEEDEEFSTANMVIGGAELIRRDALESLRLSPGEFLDRRLFLGWDEAEFCHRAGKAGYKIVIAKHALAYDSGQKGIVGGWASSPYVYYRERNKTLVAKKVLPPGLRLLFHLTHPPLTVARAAKNLFQGRRKEARAMICGLVDGYRGIGGKWRWHDRDAVFPGEIAPSKPVPL